MPILTILAGPNGAGKTTLSDYLLSEGIIPTYPLNLDMLHDEALDELSYNFFGANRDVSKVTDRLFYTYCKDAIKNKKDFCYECNLRENQVKYVGNFVNAGYRIQLIYLLLNSIDLSQDRVNYRTKHQDGNFVNQETIKMNFVEGLTNLDNHFQDFDRVILFQNSDKPLLQVDINKEKVKCFTSTFPSEELKAYLPKLSKKVQSSLLK